MSTERTAVPTKASRFLLALVAFVLGTTICVSVQATLDAQPAFAIESASVESLQQSDIELQADMNRTVWCSRTGSKYHYSSTCSRMKNPIAMTLQQAIDAGREPCSKCVHESPVPDPTPTPTPTPTPSPAPAPQPQYRGFYDVPADSWYVTSGVFDYALDNGLMKGYSDGSNKFGPNDAVTRAMAVTVLWRMAGQPVCQAADFDDVDYSARSWYGNAVRWARANGVTSGYAGVNKFGPNDPVTREQLAFMISEAAKVISHVDTSSDGSALAAKPDASSVSTWAYDAVAWSVDQGILGGASTIDPQGTATRCHGCKIFSLAHKIITGENGSH